MKTVISPDKGSGRSKPFVALGDIGNPRRCEVHVGIEVIDRWHC